MGLIPKSQTPLIGVDISSTAVKLLQSQAHRPLVQLCFAVPARG